MTGKNKNEPAVDQDALLDNDRHVTADKPKVAKQTSPAETTIGTETPAAPVSIAKLLSFALLLAIIVLLGIVFYKVMAGFLVPMFLAALLVVIFQPFHLWFLKKCNGRRALAAGLTTLSVMLTVLVPLSILMVMAVAEGQILFRQYRSPKVVQSLKDLRHSLKLDMPSATQFLEIESRFESLTRQLDAYEMAKQGLGLSEINQNAAELAGEQNLPWPAVNRATPADTPGDPSASKAPPQDKRDLTLSAWLEFHQNLAAARAIESESDWQARRRLQSKNAGRHDDRIQNNQPNEPTSAQGELDTSRQQSERKRHLNLREYENHVQLARDHFEAFKIRFLGGPTRSLFTHAVNPTDEEISSYADAMLGVVKKRLPQLGGATTAFVGSLLLGTAIMIFSLYFFLLDGERMIESVKGLSPLDDEHESELIQEFGRISRAVVIATLLSALVQGVLACIGFYFCGLESIFLLTLLSAVLAMVPFVGAASVWIPCSLYLYFNDHNLAAAIGLAIYGVTVISMADNVIKPMVLHGQSNLHPLLALLSVIGGVATLGPIGILVGPMVVVFLQTLLKILRRELDSIEPSKLPDAKLRTTD